MASEQCKPERVFKSIHSVKWVVEYHSLFKYLCYSVLEWVYVFFRYCGDSSKKTEAKGLDLKVELLVKVFDQI